MPRGKRLSLFEQGQIVALRRQNLSFRSIAAKVGRSDRVVRDFLADPNAYGTGKSSGRPKMLDERTKRRVIAAGSNTTNSSATIVFDLNLSCSPLTVRRLLHRSGRIVRSQMKKRPKITAAHKATRLKFATDKLSVPLDWDKVLFHLSIY